MGIFGSPNIEELKASKNVKGLIDALKDEDFNVRYSAAGALEEIGEPAVEPLIEALKDKNRDVRESVAYALGKIGDTLAVEPLIEALKDKDSYVRAGAAIALGKLGWQPKDYVEKINGKISDVVITSSTKKPEGEQSEAINEEIKQNGTQEGTPKQKPMSLGEAAGVSAIGGAAAGLAAHYLAGGKMTFPIFIVAYILILSGLKGLGKLVGIIVFTAVAALVVVVFQRFE